MKRRKEPESLSMLRKLPSTELLRIKKHCIYMEQIINMTPPKMMNGAIMNGLKDSNASHIFKDIDDFAKSIFNPLTIIASVDIDNVIGVGNGLAHHIKTDMRFFKQMTTGKIVVMGRKTFESMGSVPLKNRLNVIVSSRDDLDDVYEKDKESILLVKNLFDVVFRPRFIYLMQKKFGCIYDTSDTMLIGGASIYKTALDYDYVTSAIITHINGTVQNPEKELVKFPYPDIVYGQNNCVGSKFMMEPSLSIIDATDSKPLIFCFYDRIRENEAKVPDLVKRLICTKNRKSIDLEKLESTTFEKFYTD